MAHRYPPVSPYAAGLSGKCPRCGRGALFQSFLTLKANCEACGLDYAKADAGDGPAVFVIFIVGFLSVLLALFARFSFGLPTGAAYGIAAVFAVAATLFSLRPLKATLIALQFRHKAAESRGEDAGGGPS